MGEDFDAVLTLYRITKERVSPCSFQEENLAYQCTCATWTNIAASIISMKGSWLPIDDLVDWKFKDMG